LGVVMACIARLLFFFFLSFFFFFFESGRIGNGVCFLFTFFLLLFYLLWVGCSAGWMAGMI
jgi:hypothetical protein